MVNFLPSLHSIPTFHSPPHKRLLHFLPINPQVERVRKLSAHLTSACHSLPPEATTVMSEATWVSRSFHIDVTQNLKERVAHWSVGYVVIETAWRSRSPYFNQFCHSAAWIKVSLPEVRVLWFSFVYVRSCEAKHHSTELKYLKKLLKKIQMKKILAFVVVYPIKQSQAFENVAPLFWFPSLLLN